MKRGLVILAVATVTLIGCTSTKHIGYSQMSEIVVIDSVSTMHENASSPGTYSPNKDTIYIAAYYQEEVDRKGGYVGYNIKYKILNKKKY